MNGLRRVLFLLIVALQSETPAAAATLLVTNTNDSGPGSLRAAIETANASGASTIEFRIPGEGQWQTIRLESPLPPLRYAVEIDGETQRDAFGDTNPAGPEIELNGSALVSGNGLELNCGIVRGLTINGFPGNGLLLRGDCHEFDAIVERNFIGCDPTGMLSVSNERGIRVDSTSSLGHSFQYFWAIRRNVISGNERSGVFIDAGRVHVEKNIVGLNALLNGPLSNGASGVAVMLAGDGSDIDNNYIGFNHHFGVAIAKGATFVRLFANSFQANDQLAIDRGLDGVSSAEIAFPEIVSVRYANGITTVEVSASDLGDWSPHVNVYANDAPDPTGYGEGQYFLGSAFRSSGFGTQTYTFRYTGDLRGKWVTATATRSDYFGFASLSGIATSGNWQGFLSGTSEFSRAVEVK